VTCVKISTPEVPVLSIFLAQPGHPSNRARDSCLGHPEEILLVFQVTDEDAGLDPDEWFSVQSNHDGRDVQVVHVRKLPWARVCGSYRFPFGDVSCTAGSRTNPVTSGPGHEDQCGKLRCLAWPRRPGTAACESKLGNANSAPEALS